MQEIIIENVNHTLDPGESLLFEIELIPGNKTIIDLYKGTPNYDQFLLRALARRICEYIGHQNHIENTQDRSEDIVKHLNIIDIISRA